MSPGAQGEDASVSAAVLLWSDCRPLRRSLRPLVWMTLEEVALDAVVDDGRLVARTSARLMAERLGIDPGTASAALRDLRRRGLVTSARETGVSGRFGLSVYQLGPVAGLSVVQPRVAEPRMVSPSVVQPGMAEPAMVVPRLDPPEVEPPVLGAPDSGGPDRRTPGTDTLPSPTAADRTDPSCRTWTGRRPSRGVVLDAGPSQSPQCPGQETLDLGAGS